MDLVKEKEESKKKIILSCVVGVLALMASLPMIIISKTLEMELWLRITLNVIAVLVLIGGIAVACVLDMDAGTFECKHCGARFKPTVGAYMKGAHTPTKRYLKCPECGRSSYCKHRLTH